jgi:hypothetical protein
MSEVVPFGPSGPDPERERRHVAYFNNPENSRRLADGALAAWQEEGRGFFAISDLIKPDERGDTTMAYILLSRMDRFPNDEMRRDIERMVRSYDPRYQFVVAIEEEGKVSAYKVRIVNPTNN